MDRHIVVLHYTKLNVDTFGQVTVNGNCFKVFKINGSENTKNFDFSRINNGNEQYIYIVDC